MRTRKPLIGTGVGWAMALILCFSPAWAGSALIEDLGAARMDWQTRTLTASGQADTPQPEMDIAQDASQIQTRQAKLRARKALWQGLLRVRVDGDQTVKDVLQSRPERSEELRELVQTSSIQDIAPEPPTGSSRQTSSDRTKEIPAYRARFSLSGRGAALCIPSQLWYEETDLAAPPENRSQDAASRTFTSLIVDARGLGEASFGLPFV